MKLLTAYTDLATYYSVGDTIDVIEAAFASRIHSDSFDLIAGNQMIRRHLRACMQLSRMNSRAASASSLRPVTRNYLESLENYNSI